MQRKLTRGIALLLVSAVMTSPLYCPTADAARAKLSKTKLTLKKGASYTLKAKGVRNAAWTTNKKNIVKLSAKKKTSVKITGLQPGKADVTATYTAGKSRKKLTCKVTVTSAKNNTNNPATNAPVSGGSNSAAATATPTAEVPTAAPTAIPTEPATASPSPTLLPSPYPSPSVVSEKGTWAYIPFPDDTLLKEFEPIFGNVGTCLTYKGMFGKNEMQDYDTMNFVIKNYNSFTLENEMKPSYMLADADKNFRNPPLNKLLSVSEATAAGYTIPEDYTESSVPSINYERIDAIMKTSYEYGIRMRGHTLIWHSQTPMAFFKVGYDEDNDFVTPEVMNQRVIFYVTNVMKHVLDSEYSSVVYTWDIVNEYFHQLSDNTAPNWSAIYNIKTGSSLSTKPVYVKIAFKTAYDILKSYGLNDKVTLFYNDYNTSQVSNEIVEMVNYINEADDINTDGERICSGVGMQCHLDVKWPSVKEQLDTVKKFLDEGFEVQITELDIINSTNGKDEVSLCEYWYAFLKGLVDFRKEGRNITGITFWGLSDSVSWRFGQSALLYGESIDDPKTSLYAAYAAAQTWLNLGSQNP